MICISVRESPFYGIMQAGQKLGIVYIGEAGGKVSAEMFSVTGFIYGLYYFAKRNETKSGEIEQN